MRLCPVQSGNSHCGGTRRGDWFTLGDVPGLTTGVTMRVTEYGTVPVLGKVGSAVAWLG